MAPPVPTLGAAVIACSQHWMQLLFCSHPGQESSVFRFPAFSGSALKALLWALTIRLELKAPVHTQLPGKDGRVDIAVS